VEVLPFERLRVPALVVELLGRLMLSFEKITEEQVSCPLLSILPSLNFRFCPLRSALCSLLTAPYFLVFNLCSLLSTFYTLPFALFLLLSALCPFLALSPSLSREQDSYTFHHKVFVQAVRLLEVLARTNEAAFAPHFQVHSLCLSFSHRKKRKRTN
jgi:hypothetical protein